MVSEQEERLSYKSIKKIVHEACSRLRQREDAQYNQDVLEALHDLTGLPNSELAEIARGMVREDCRAFFSVKQQVMIVGGFFLILLLAFRLF